MRLLLSGKTSSGRRVHADGREPVPGGWNRIHIQVEDLAAEVQRLRDAGLKFRNDIITGSGGSQIMLDDPSGIPANYSNRLNSGEVEADHRSMKKDKTMKKTREQRLEGRKEDLFSANQREKQGAD